MTEKNSEYAFVRVLECKQGAVRAVRFNVDGCYCMTCGSDKSVKLWNPHKGTLLHTYSGHGYEVLDARGSCDNSLIASCGLDKSVFLWNVSTGAVLRRYVGHNARVNCVTFNEEGTVVLSGSLDGSVRIWDARSKSKTPIQILDEAKDSVMSVVISRAEILTSCLDGFTRVYDVRNGKLTSNCIGASITCASFSGDSECILVSSVNSGLRLMDKETGEMLSKYKGHKTTDIKIESCIDAADVHIFSGSEDGKIYCWNLISEEIKFSLNHIGSKVVHSLSHHPSDPMLLSATMGQIWLWGNQEEKD